MLIVPEYRSEKKLSTFQYYLHENEVLNNFDVLKEVFVTISVAVRFEMPQENVILL